MSKLGHLMGLGRLGQSLTAKEVFDLVKGDLEKVEREIGVESTASVETIARIAQYMQGNGGKRLRPILVLLSCKLFGEVTPEAIRLAAVMELIHTATLVHDDVIDVANTRRGKPSANVLWGNHTSVLAGDWLYMQAFQIALRQRNFHVLDVLIGLTQMMVEGELLQLERIGRIDISEADYMELIDRKTASLFAACAKLGALVAGASEAMEAKLGEFAWSLGIAFQLIDDVLDFTARENVLGKPVGNDLREGKITLPLIYALQDASAEERRAVETVLKDQHYEHVPFKEIRRVIERHNGFERARERAHMFTERARAIIHEFPESPYQRALATVTDLVTDRDR
ncbi:MAG: polyprenyl synthetase family protein [Bryobacteraceae bacterium]|nr:polyprenyl synthetase family protein [Bryobacteraceae bacterium]